MDEKRLDRLENKIDKTLERLTNVDVTLATLTETVVIHEKRSTNLEKQMEPIKKHVAAVHGVLKFIGLVAVVVAILEGISKMTGH